MTLLVLNFGRQPIKLILENFPFGQSKFSAAVQLDVPLRFATSVSFPKLVV